MRVVQILQNNLFYFALVLFWCGLVFKLIVAEGF